MSGIENSKKIEVSGGSNDTKKEISMGPMADSLPELSEKKEFATKCIALIEEHMNEFYKDVLDHVRSLQ
uniref:PA28_beta domain-containing protein n=1 Tax=Caenorhabditis tropicalis TaxID=1561998 RepID=A0A1I7UP09_9PELO